jgi:DNA repair protein RecO (recombination protein O)
MPQLRLDTGLMSEMEAVMHALLRYHLERDLKSWGFLEVFS